VSSAVQRANDETRFSQINVTILMLPARLNILKSSGRDEMPADVGRDS